VITIVEKDNPQKTVHHNISVLHCFYTTSFIRQLGSDCQHNGKVKLALSAKTVLTSALKKYKIGVHVVVYILDCTICFPFKIIIMFLTT